MTRPCALSLAVFLLVAASARAQSTTPAAPSSNQNAAGSAAQNVGDSTLIVPPDGYAYQAEGRRDPFLGVFINPEPRGVLKRGDGAAAYAVNEISVRGVMQSRGLLIAMVQGPDKRTYIVHSGDKLADGVVKTVTPQGLVIVQHINDPLSVQKQREVRKLLPSAEDIKE